MKLKPYKKIRRNYKLKKYNKKRKVAINANLSIPGALGGFDESTLTKMRVNINSVKLIQNGTLQNVANEIWSLNDPTNGDTVAPIGWITYKTMYDKYMVVGSKLKITYTNLSQTTPYRAFVIPYQGDNLPINGQTFAGQPRCKTKYMSVQGGSKDVVTISSYQSLKNITGNRKLNSNDDQYCGYTGSPNSNIIFSEPVEYYQWSFGVITSNGQPTDDQDPVYVDLEITYYVKFFQKLQGAY